MFEDDRVGMQVSLKPIAVAADVAARLGLPSPRVIRWKPVSTTGRAWSFMVEHIGQRVYMEFNRETDLVEGGDLNETPRRYSAAFLQKAVDRRDKRVGRAQRCTDAGRYPGYMNTTGWENGPWFVRDSKRDSPRIETRSDDQILMDKLKEADVRSWLMHEHLVGEYVGQKRRRYFTLSVPDHCRCVVCATKGRLSDIAEEPTKVACMCCGEDRTRFVRCSECRHVCCAECCAAVNWVA
jgi:hypothetical protein